MTTLATDLLKLIGDEEQTETLPAPPDQPSLADELLEIATTPDTADDEPQLRPFDPGPLEGSGFQLRPGDPPSASATPTGRLYNASQTIARSIVAIPGRLAQDVALGFKKLQDGFPKMLLKDVDPDLEEATLWKWGQSIINFANESFPGDPQLRDDFVSETLPGGFVSMGTYLVGGSVALAAKGPRAATAVVGLLGGGAEATNLFQRAKAKGATDDTAMQASGWGFLVGLSEIIPVNRLFKRFNQASGGKLFKRFIAKMKAGFAGSAEEMIQEGVIQAPGSNLIAKAIFDEEQALFEDAFEQGAAGGIIGFTMNVIATAAGAKRLMRPGGPAIESRPLTPQEMWQVAPQKAVALIEAVDKRGAPSRSEFKEAGAGEPGSKRTRNEYVEKLREEKAVQDSIEEPIKFTPEDLAEIEAVANEPAQAPIEETPGERQSRKVAEVRKMLAERRSPPTDKKAETREKQAEPPVDEASEEVVAEAIFPKPISYTFKNTKEGRRLAEELKSKLPEVFQNQVHITSAVKKGFREATGEKIAKRDGTDVMAQTIMESGLANARTPRPDLAITSVDDRLRNLQRLTDSMRDERGENQVRSDGQVREEATARLQADPIGERQRFIESAEDPEHLDVGNVVGASFISQEGLRALETGAIEDFNRVTEIMIAYRTRKREQARGLKVVVDPIENPGQRRARYLAEELLTIPDAVADGILAAREEGNKTKAEQLTKEWNETVQAIREELKNRGIDLNKIREIAADPVAYAKALKALRDVRSDKKVPISDAAFEYWQSMGLLSAITTATTNVLGFSNAAWNMTAERLLRGMINTFGIRKPDDVQLSEFRPMLAATLPAFSRAARNAWMTLYTELPYFEASLNVDPKKFGGKFLDDPRTVIPGKIGRVIRFPRTMMQVADEFAKTLITTAEAAAIAHRMAKKEGLSGEGMRLRMAELLDSTSSPVWLPALEEAKEGLFQLPTPLSRAALKLRKNPGVRWLIPFATTPASIMLQGVVDKSIVAPFTLPFKVWEAVKTGNTQKLTKRMAQSIIAGSFAYILMGQDDDDPWITGALTPETGAARPSTSKKEASSGDPAFSQSARERSRRGYPQFSIHIGDTSYSYSRVPEPFSTGIAITADMVRTLKSGDTAPEKMVSAWRSFAGQVDSKTFLRGMADLIRAAGGAWEGNPKGLARWASNFSASWVPNIIRSGMREGDSVYPERAVWGKGPEWFTRLAQRTVQKTELNLIPDTPKIDLWGRESSREIFPGSPVSDWLYRMTVPVKVVRRDLALGDRLIHNFNGKQNTPDDKLKTALIPKPRWTEQGKTRHLSDAEYNQWLQLSGQIADRIVGSHALFMDIENPTEDNMKQVEGAIRVGRKIARVFLKEEWKINPKSVDDPLTVPTLLDRAIPKP